MSILPVLSYCGKDCDSALRFLYWCAFLSGENGSNLKNESILLLPSKAVEPRRRHREIVQAAIESWGHVYVHINPFDDERGWPSSPNTQFYSALTHIETFFSADMLWLEPDAVPLCEDWLDVIKAEWEVARFESKTFCASRVRHYKDHCTGIGVYGSNWRQVAPKLATIIKNNSGIHEAWDTHAADQMMPNAYFTKVVQHIFYTPAINGLDILSEDAVIFHQDKASKLIALLDEELYDGKAANDARWSYLGIEPTMSEMKFFHADNSNRKIRSQGLVFTFEPYEFVAGSWRGTFATQDDAQIVALMALAADAGSAVTEISKDEFEAKSKKKVIASPISEPSNPAYQARINTSPSEVVVVQEPSQLPDSVTANPVSENIEDIIRIGKVEPARPMESKGREKKMRPGKAKT